MRKILSLLLLVALPVTLLAEEKLVIQAKELFNDQKYSSAQNILNYLSATDYANSEIFYLNAKCSKELFLSDAKFLYDKLNNRFPYHLYKNDVSIDLGKIHFREQKYADAILDFLDVINPSNELLFKIGYSYFSLDSLEMANFYFSKIMKTKSKYAPASKYYYAFIAYKRGLYKSALENFKELLSNDVFGDIVPYYISQIYFFQKEYEKLIKFAKPLSEKVANKRKSEINRLLAEAYYRTNDFKTAVSLFEVCVSDEKDRNSFLHFFLGHCYYKSLDFENAILNFEYVLDAPDSVMQYSYYFLGISYIQIGNFNYALQAFKQSSKYNFNKKLKEEAYFNYAKLAYQLDLPIENTLQTLNNYLKNFDNPANTQHINLLVAQILQSSSQYEEAYSVLNAVSNPTFDQQKSIQRLGFFLGVKEFNQLNFKNAIPYFSAAATYDINATYTYLSKFWIADCNFQTQNYHEAIKNYTELDFLDKQNVKYYDNLKKYNLAYSYFQNSDYNNAVKWFRSYEKVCKDSAKLNDTYLRIADSYFMMTDFALSAKYYSKASVINYFDVDYALYQNSICVGLEEDFSNRVKILNQIISNFPSSSYFDNALYDLAKHYKNSGEYNLANKYYDELILISADNNLIANAYLSKAMIAFNSGYTDLAIDNFMFVLKNYKQKKIIKEALSGLQLAYASKAQIEDYLELVDSLQFINITKSEQDSLTYHTAFMKFAEGDFKVAQKAFAKYIDGFTSGVFIEDAIYYNAISSFKIGDTSSAVLNYNKIIEFSVSSYKEEALIFLSRNSYTLADYSKSNTFYTQLLEYVSSNSIRREAIIRLMIGNETIDDSLALLYAKQVVSFKKIDDWLLSKAYIIIARADFSLGDYEKSKSSLNIVSKLSFHDEGAEANFYLANIAYIEGNLDLAEQIIFSLVADFSNDYYIAKSFILLSDIYVAKNNLFQAKATLKSIVDNHDNNDLINIARKKWEIIVESEKEKKEVRFSNQTFIEISEQECEYLIEEIDEEYIVSFTDSINFATDSLQIINKNKIADE